MNEARYFDRTLDKILDMLGKEQKSESEVLEKYTELSKDKNNKERLIMVPDCVRELGGFKMGPKEYYMAAQKCKQAMRAHT